MLEREVRRVLRVLPAALAGLIMWSAAGALPASAQVPLTTEKVPTLAGMDLPLRPGERIIPTASEDCSVIAFAPDKTRHDRFANFWKKRTWVGACRFGLAHGAGFAVAVSDSSALEMTMVYGLEIVKQATWEDIPYRDEPGTYRRKTSNFLVGAAFSDLSAVRYRLKAFDSYEPVRTIAQAAADWMTDSYLQVQTFDAAGNERVLHLLQADVAGQCDSVGERYKAFASEVKKACRTKPADKQLLIRTEGPSSVPPDNHQVVWAKACPVAKGDSWAECNELLREALGSDWAGFEAAIAGDGAARAAAKAEIFARFAPLERALEAKLKGAGNSTP